MFKTDIGRTIAAVACTIVMSTACVLGAVAPAQPGTGKVAVATAARLVA